MVVPRKLGASQLLAEYCVYSSHDQHHQFHDQGRRPTDDGLHSVQ